MPTPCDRAHEGLRTQPSPCNPHCRVHTSHCTQTRPQRCQQPWTHLITRSPGCTASLTRLQLDSAQSNPNQSVGHAQLQGDGPGTWAANTCNSRSRVSPGSISAFLHTRHPVTWKQHNNYLAGVAGPLMHVTTKPWTKEVLPAVTNGSVHRTRSLQHGGQTLWCGLVALAVARGTTYPPLGTLTGRRGAPGQHDSSRAALSAWLASEPAGCPSAARSCNGRAPDHAGGTTTASYPEWWSTHHRSHAYTVAQSPILASWIRRQHGCMHTRTTTVCAPLQAARAHLNMTRPFITTTKSGTGHG